MRTATSHGLLSDFFFFFCAECPLAVSTGPLGLSRGHSRVHCNILRNDSLWAAPGDRKSPGYGAKKTRERKKRAMPHVCKTRYVVFISLFFS